MIYSDILRSIRTIGQVERLSYEIDVLLGSLFKKHSFDQSLKSVSSVASDEIREALVKNNIKLSDRQTIKDYLVGLRDKIHNFKTIKIFLAFQPSEVTIDNIFTFVLKNFGFGFILDIKEDRTIFGGAIISFRGKYKDYSLRKAIEEAFVNKREEITRLLI